MRAFILILTMVFTFQSEARMEVLFHPHDPTLEKIASWISEAKHSVDIAMYSMDTSERSPIIKMLHSPAVQERIQNKTLQIRLIFEGYGTALENAERMAALESLGIDVRFLGKSVKMHHKFAVIDAGGSFGRVITGSANWSLSSYRNYNENILFMDNENEATFRFHQEFSRLWAAAKEYGVSTSYNPVIVDPQEQDHIEVYFNSPRRIGPKGEEESHLTSQVVRLIQSSQSEIAVATTRIRITAILDAVKEAAARGVRVKILISQDDFADLDKRADWLYGNPLIEVRVKFYSLRISDYMYFQMHNKFMISDQNTVLTGSFNWSNSSENSHIENLVELQKTNSNDVISKYNSEFESLWNMNRLGIDEIRQTMQQAVDQGQNPKCGFVPTAFKVEEIKDLLKRFPKCGGATTSDLTL